MANNIDNKFYNPKDGNYHDAKQQQDFFKVGEYYPPLKDKARVMRYRKNKLLFLGKHFEIMMNVNRKYQDLLYVSMNLTSIICKKNADFLFSHPATILPKDGSTEETTEAFERIIEDNHLDIVNYESALSNSYNGDAFYKIRWGQNYHGALDEENDPYRVIIENQNAQFVFAETQPFDIKQIKAYHIALPVSEDNKGVHWTLHVESHYPGLIKYRRYEISVIETTVWGVPILFKINTEIEKYREEVYTGIPYPLVVHVPNFALDDCWEGIDDISEIFSIQDEINNRLTQISSILDKHSDPAMAVPVGTLREDDTGRPQFNVSTERVFEYDGKNDAVPMYITWDGKLETCFREIELLIDKAFMIAEIPPLALGAGDQGTSKTSGTAVKLRMMSISSKIKRKEKYYRKGLQQVMTIAQLLENTYGEYSYEVQPADIIFTDAIPRDDMENANIMSIRTGNKPTMSVTKALMKYDGLSKAQAEAEKEDIGDEGEENMERMQKFNEKVGGPGGIPSNKPGSEPGNDNGSNGTSKQIEKEE